MQKFVFSVFLFFVLELATIIQVGTVIGALNTILLLLVFFAIGCSLLRRRFSMILRGELPGDGLLFVPVAGILFIFPGFISDVMALLLLLPPVQKLFAKRFSSISAGAFHFSKGHGGAERGSFRQGNTIDVTPVHEDKSDNR
ncbi:MAG: FxsA family protein [Succinivibrio sp.]